MRIVVIGSTTLTSRVINTIVQSIPSVELVGVITAPSRFRISYAPEGVDNVLHVDIRAQCMTHDIEVVEMLGSMSEPGLVDALMRWSPGAVIVAGWYHMIPMQLLSEFPFYGIHASLLPLYSGGAPLVWAMIKGEKVTGVSLFQMDLGVDSGPILGQREVSIEDTDTIATLYQSVEGEAIDLLRSLLPQIADGTCKFQEQNESLGSVMPQRKPADGVIDWNNDCVFIGRWIRAQTRQYPGAFTKFNKAKLILWQATPVHSEHVGILGQVIRSDDEYPRVICGEGSLRLIKVSFQERDYFGADIWNLFGNNNPILG